MNCALCGAKTRRGGPVFSAQLSSLAGQEACDWCGTREGKLIRGELSQAGLDELMQYARSHEDVQVADELERLWQDPGVLKQEDDSRLQALEDELNALADAIQITSGFNFEDQGIAAYLGFASAEVVLGTGVLRGIRADFANFFGAESEAFRRKLTEAKEVAFRRLRRQVVEMGGNAIIGVDLDYTMFGADLIGVIASGTAVRLAPTPVRTT